MEAKEKRRKVLVSAALAGLLALSLVVYGGGSLEPSAPPGPIMKTLDEVEPRVAIAASDLPLTITEPNSYYFTETINFGPNDVNAITIEANDVTINLVGFSLIGPGSGTGCGIYMNGCANVEIRNGTIRDFGFAIASSGGNSHRVINIRALSNVFGILIAGSGHLIKDCTAAGNDSFGINTYTSNGCTVTGNTCYDNGAHGIYTSTSNGCTVTGNTCCNNAVDGINVGSSSTVTGNTAYYNGVNGISSSSGCTVTGNTCYNNGDDGIYTSHGSTVIGNTARNNTDEGIHTGDICLVDQNTATDNSTNLVTGTGCVLGTNCAP